LMCEAFRVRAGFRSSIERRSRSRWQRSNEYKHEPRLGRRSAAQGFTNTAWRIASFRAYADHMERKSFERS
jgi:hypothetical protein